MSYNYYYPSDSELSSDNDAESPEPDSDEEMDISGQGDSEWTRSSQSPEGNFHMHDASDAQSLRGQGSMTSAPQLGATEGDPSSSTSDEQNPSREASRTPSPTSSVVTLSDSLRANMYRREYGRSLATYSDVYRFPMDGEEWERQKKQHLMLIRLMGGKYPPPMVEIMTSSIEGERACLDLGCGVGSWIKDVARDFPKCRAVAVDLVPIADTGDMPSNLRSEVDDINLGLQHFYGTFDVVHCRLIATGIKDYQLLIENIARVLRPGGLIELGETDFYSYDAEHRCIQMTTVELGPPWWARWMTFMRAAISHSGGDVGAASHLFTWIKNHEAFKDVVYQELWIPVIPPADRNSNEPLYLDDIMTFLRTGRPLLLGSGLSEESLDILERNIVRELQEGEFVQYARFQWVYAIRNSVVLD